jgi:hypothetical protein
VRITAQIECVRLSNLTLEELSGDNIGIESYEFDTGLFAPIPNPVPPPVYAASDAASNAASDAATDAATDSPASCIRVKPMTYVGSSSPEQDNNINTRLSESPSSETTSSARNRSQPAITFSSDDHENSSSDPKGNTSSRLSSPTPEPATPHLNPRSSPSTPAQPPRYELRSRPNQGFPPCSTS